MRSALMDLGISHKRIGVRACGGNQGLGEDNVDVEYAGSREELKSACERPTTPKEKPGLKYDSEIIRAIRSNDPETVRTYLAAGGDVHARTRGPRGAGWTLLHHAANAGSVEVANQLLEAGADANAQVSNYQVSPLHRAAIKGQLNMAGFLLDRGAKIDALNGSGETPLFNAVTYGNLATARLLLARGAKIDRSRSKRGPPVMATTSIGKRDFQRVPLRIVWSGLEGVLPMLELLIEHGADLSVRNQEGRTLIEEWASQTCVMGHPAGRDVIKRLLQLDAPYSKAGIEKALYMGMNNPLAKQACEKLADLFSSTIDVANIDPDEIFAKEINDLLGVCHIAWSHEVASRIKNEASDVPAAYLNARLYVQVARRHAEKHQMPEPKIIPIPLKKGDAGMKILDIPPNLLRQGVFKQKDKMCPDAAVRAVGQAEFNEIETRLKAEHN